MNPLSRRVVRLEERWQPPRDTLHHLSDAQLVHMIALALDDYQAEGVDPEEALDDLRMVGSDFGVIYQEGEDARAYWARVSEELKAQAGEVPPYEALGRRWAG